jgi:hypothetical protein
VAFVERHARVRLGIAIHVFRTPSLSRCLGKLEIDACIVIHSLCCSDIKLVDRYIAVMLVPDIECGVRQNVVMDLLRRAAVFEDKRGRFLTLGG